MAKLVWDDTGKRLYETGIDQVVLFPMDSEGDYGDGIAWNGVTGITESPEGADANDIYADNTKYLSLISAENWKGTIKAYTYPKEFNKCQGEYEYNDGIYSGVFFGQQTHTKFGLAWRTIVGNDTEGDAYGYKIHLAYGLTAAPSEKDHATVNDSPEATEYSWEINSIPAAFTKAFTEDSDVLLKPVSHVVIDSKDNSDVYNAIAELVFGSDNASASLPVPDDLVDIIEDDYT